ncbi:MAG: hypothetical protein HY074_01340 [Deltaproteobacteria bacterium]|nr:hypothetical protein [Deltaproteobacteria bacterium]
MESTSECDHLSGGTVVNKIAFLKTRLAQSSRILWRRHDFSELRYSISFESAAAAVQPDRNWLGEKLYISEFTKRGLLSRVLKIQSVGVGESLVLHIAVDLVNPKDEPLHKVFFITARLVSAKRLSGTETLIALEIDHDSWPQWRRFRALFRLAQLRVNRLMRKARGW